MKRMEALDKISSHLTGVLGDNGKEEQRIKSANDVVWWSIETSERHNARLEEAQSLRAAVADLEAKSNRSESDEMLYVRAQEELRAVEQRLEESEAYLAQDWQIKLVRIQNNAAIESSAIHSVGVGQ